MGQSYDLSFWLSLSELGTFDPKLYADNLFHSAHKCPQKLFLANLVTAQGTSKGQILEEMAEDSWYYVTFSFSFWVLTL